MKQVIDELIHGKIKSIQFLKFLYKKCIKEKLKSELSPEILDPALAIDCVYAGFGNPA